MNLLRAFAVLLLVSGPGGCERPGDVGRTDAPLEGDSALRARQATVHDSSVAPARFVGLEHPPYPEGVERLAGSVVQDEVWRSGARAAWTYASIRAGGRPMLWLNRIVGRDTTPMMDGERRVGWHVRSRFRVADAVALPRLEPDERLVLGTCKMPDSVHVAAIVPWRRDRAVMTDVRIAWRVDEVSGSLSAADPSRVTCRNTAFPRP